MSFFDYRLVDQDRYKQKRFSLCFPSITEA